MCRCIHRSADVTTKAVVGITTLRKSIFKSILNTELPMISLLTGKRRGEEKREEANKTTPPGYIPPHYVEKSQSERSNFFRFLFTLLTSYYGDKAKEVLKRLLEEYRLGLPVTALLSFGR